MEKDTLVAHGASMLLKERFDSDKTIIPISNESGLIAVYDARKIETIVQLLVKKEVLKKLKYLMHSS
jgi:DNA-directed RNA polymerase beta subunit